MIERIAVTLGRCLLGLYFFAPGLSKITSYQAMLDYMTLHNIPAPGLLLPLTTLLQIGGGLSLMAGYRIRETALMFAGMTLLINRACTISGTAIRKPIRAMNCRTSSRTLASSPDCWS